MNSGEMSKLNLEKAGEPEIKLPTFIGSSRKQESSRKTSAISFIDYAKAFDCVDHNKLWKILQETGIPDHLICLLWDLYADQEATVRTGHGTTHWFQIGKGVRQGCMLSACLFSLCAEYIVRNAGLEEAQAVIKFAGRNINNLRYADDTMLMAESKEELTSLLIRVKEKSEKVGLKLNIQKTKIMASGPITSWQIDGETVETVSDFTFLCSKITADGNYSHEIKRHLLFGRKAAVNLNNMLKSWDITLLTKVHLVRAMVFPVGMYICESWTIRKAEHQRTDVFELWCWRRLLSIPWTARRSKQSILKKSVLNIHWKDWCWSWKSNTLATWFEQLTPWKRPCCWERLKVRGEGDDRGWDVWMTSRTQWTWVWVNSGSWWWIGRPGMLQSMGSQRVGHDWATELNWTELNRLERHGFRGHWFSLLPWNTHVCVLCSFSCVWLFATPWTV